MEIDRGIITIREGKLAGEIVRGQTIEDIEELKPIYVEIRLKPKKLDRTLKNLKGILNEITSWQESIEKAIERSASTGAGGVGVGFVASILGFFIKSNNQTIILGSGIGVFIFSTILGCYFGHKKVSDLSAWHEPIYKTDILSQRSLRSLKGYCIPSMGVLAQSNPIIGPRRRSEQSAMSEGYSTSLCNRSASSLEPMLKNFVSALEAVKDSKDINILRARGMPYSVQPAGFQSIFLDTGAIVRVMGPAEQKTEARNSKGETTQPLLSVFINGMTLELPPEDLSTAIQAFEKIAEKLRSDEGICCDDELCKWFTIVALIFGTIVFESMDIVSMVEHGVKSEDIAGQVATAMVWVIFGYYRYAAKKAENDVMNTPVSQYDFLSDRDKRFLGKYIHIKGVVAIDVITIAELKWAIRYIFLPVLCDIQNKFYPELSRALGWIASPAAAKSCPPCSINHH